jgi:hypothetical protein
MCLSCICINPRIVLAALEYVILLSAIIRASPPALLIELPIRLLSVDYFFRLPPVPLIAPRYFFEPNKTVGTPIRLHRPNPQGANEEHAHLATRRVFTTLWQQHTNFLHSHLVSNPSKITMAANLRCFLLYNLPRCRTSLRFSSPCIKKSARELYSISELSSGAFWGD